jgi:hypothetical protein
MTRTLTPTLVLLLLAGCAATPAQRVDTPRTEGPNKSYTVDLPTGWIKQTAADHKALLVSRNGFLLEVIVFTRRSLKEAFPRSKKAATAEMLPAELAELEIAETKLQDEFTAALNVLQNEPAEISGAEGYKLHMSYKNSRGLEIQRVVYGFADESAYYRIHFTAPKLYYFDTYYPEFEKTVASFKATGKS